jgi:hypothetical protein
MPEWPNLQLTTFGELAAGLPYLLRYGGAVGTDVRPARAEEYLTGANCGMGHCDLTKALPNR